MTKTKTIRTAENAKNTEKKLTYEKAAERLEEIVRLLGGDGGIPLEGVVELYREGVEMAAVCAKELEKAEKEVLLLTEGGDGEPSWSVFREDGDEP